MEERTRIDQEGFVATKQAFLEPRHLFTPFFATSKVGFGICDTQLRYQAINGALAATNRRPPRDHLGSTIQEVLGHVASQIEPAFERVLRSEQPVLKEISGRIPTRGDEVHWIANYFPVKDSSGKVRGLGAIVVEVTEHKALQASLQLLGQQLLHSGEKVCTRIANEMHASTVKYHATLKQSLSQLVRPIWQSADRASLLAQSSELLKHFPVVPPEGMLTARRLFREIEQNPELREGLFARIANDPQLQRVMLRALSRYPEAEKELVTEFAKRLNLCRWLLKIAGRKF